MSVNRRCQGREKDLLTFSESLGKSKYIPGLRECLAFCYLKSGLRADVTVEKIRNVKDSKGGWSG